MATTYEPMATLISNTTMEKIFINGVHKQYRITPNDGYLLHDNVADVYEGVDEDGNFIGEPSLGFTTHFCTCAASYDFDANPREFYAVLATQLPENSYTYGVEAPDHELA